MARIGDCAICCALWTRRALRRASPSGAPPNSWSAQDPGVESVARRQRRDARCGHREACAPRRLQRVHIHRLARFGRRVRAVPAPAPAGLTHPNPVRRAHARPRVFGLVHERLQQPGGDSRGGARSRRRPPVRPGPRRGRPGCGTRCRGAPTAGTVPAPGSGECAGARRPIRSRRRGRAGAAHMPRTRRRPASHVPSPPDTAVADRQTDRRSAGARAPSACSRPGAARRSPPAPAPSPERADRARHVNCRRHRVREHTRAAHTVARGPTLRQRDVACRPEVGQRRAATRTLPAATVIVEIERFTNAIGDLPEADNAL